MTEVRIRHINEAESAHLGEVPFTADALSDAITLVQSWGVSVDGEDANGTVGQLVIDGRRAYFEVVVGDE